MFVIRWQFNEISWHLTSVIRSIFHIYFFRFNLFFFVCLFQISRWKPCFFSSIFFYVLEIKFINHFIDCTYQQHKLLVPNINGRNRAQFSLCINYRQLFPTDESFAFVCNIRALFLWLLQLWSMVLSPNYATYTAVWCIWVGFCRRRHHHHRRNYTDLIFPITIIEIRVDMDNGWGRDSNGRWARERKRERKGIIVKMISIL